jgi:hypothetical protein
MLTSSMKRIAAVVAISGAAVLVLSRGPAAADQIQLPAGTACQFPVLLDTGPDSRNSHTFTDADGNVRMIVAGLANSVTLTNLDTDAALSFPATGAMWNIVMRPDGTSTFTANGHFVLILFPTDVPAGPSTTRYVGHVVFTIDANNNFTLQRTNGTATDLCAALSP